MAHYVTLPDIDARINEVWLEAKLSGVERAILRDLIAVRGYLERYGGHTFTCPVSRWLLQFQLGNEDETTEPSCTCGWTQITKSPGATHGELPASPGE